MVNWIVWNRTVWHLKGKELLPLQHLGVVSIEKGAFWSPSTTVANFTFTSLKRKLGSDLTETFKITNEISYDGRHFFNISPQTGNLLSKQISKTKMGTFTFLFL